jgi:tetratricopeptide (TPR) repeat protein
MVNTLIVFSKPNDSALFYLAKAKPIIKKLNNHNLNIQYYNKIAQGKRLREDFSGAIVDYIKVKSEAEENNDLLHMFTSQKMIGICYEALGEFVAARKFLLSALQPAIKNNYIKEQVEVLQELVNVEEQLNNKSQAFLYLKQVTVIKDSMNAAATKKAIAEIENKFFSVAKQEKH